ncbi:diuretic hormone receptor-like [Macrobrachium rosenbergii]|uniref:diuretic hormone receptor-like n=1 Tax=Macrobrachium rosenbergii TaxID=79674 RepID=UPI0034D50FD2
MAPSIAVSAGENDYLDADAINEANSLDPLDLVLHDPNINLEDSDSDVVSRVRATMYSQFMKQSKKLNDTHENSEHDHKLLKCFHEYVISIMEPQYGPGACPVKFDGVSCWPETPPGTVRSIPCFTDFNGINYEPTENNATLYCYPNGTWSKTSYYNLCLNFVTPAPEPEVTVTTNTTIFYVGNSLSLVAVTIALWIFISFKDLRCLRNKIHSNLLFTYLLHNLLWITYASVQTMIIETVTCIFYVALNYLIVTNFMWMFVEGLYLYVLVVKTFSVENIKLRVYTILGWGVPVPIIILWVVLKLQLTNDHRGTELEETGMEGPEMEGILKTCPVLPGSAIDWALRAPMLLLLSINILFLAIIMWVLITKLRSANTVETQRYRKATKALLVLIPLLGLTYMLFIALPSELEHLQTIMLSTQGFWVAVFYCFLNTEVQNSIRHHIERWRTERGISEARRMSLRHSSMREDSPRNRNSFRSYGRRLFGGKRESLCSELTTMSTSVTNGYNPVSTHAPTAPPPPPPPTAQNAVTVPLMRNHCSCLNSTAGLNACCEEEVKMMMRDSVI